MRNYIILLSVFSIVCYGCIKIIFAYWLTTNFMPAELMVGLLFALATASYLIVFYSKDGNPGNFVYAYNGTTFGRLLLCGAFVFIAALTHKSDAKAFVITFLILYFLFSILQVVGVKMFLKKK
jgi:hypothetical protein